MIQIADYFPYILHAIAVRVNAAVAILHQSLSILLTALNHLLNRELRGNFVTQAVGLNQMFQVPAR
jgi:hypothetical protein